MQILTDSKWIPTMVVLVVLDVWTLSIIWYSKQKAKPILKDAVGGILLWLLHNVLETEPVFFYTGPVIEIISF
jgi:hypothetical protein